MTPNVSATEAVTQQVLDDFAASTAIGLEWSLPFAIALFLTVAAAMFFVRLLWGSVPDS